MSTVRPFKAIRPAKEYAEKVESLPYDVMNREEATEMAKDNLYSFLHICRSEIDLPEVEDVYSPEVYKKAKTNIDERLQKGIFIEEDKPAFYIYRQKMDGRYQTGIVGCVSVDEYMNNTIKKHELTRVEKEQDRINHFDACNADTEPVFLTYRDDKRIRTIVEGFMNAHDPEYDFTDPTGIGHTLWVIDDDALIKGITDLFKEIPALYIADGHHRSASAAKVGAKRREQNPGYTGDEEFNYFMAAILPDTDLKCYDYNRVVKDLNGNSKEEFFAKVKAAGFDLENMGADPYRPAHKHEFSMYIDGEWYKMTAADKLVPGDIIGALDVSILQKNLLDPILDIKDPRTSDRIDFIGGIRGLEELKRRADSDMQLAIAVYPLSVDELFAVADGELEMPPKSTWFEPKLGSGLFMHRL